MAKDVISNIEKTIEDTSSPDQVAAMREVKQQKAGMYKLDPVGRVLVSKDEGKVWESRKTGGIKRMRWLFDAWNEAEAYYAAGQMDHRRVTGGERKGNDVVSKNRNRKFSSTDNIVYSTVNAEIPSLYAKNPEVTITMNNMAMEGAGAILQKFANNIINRKDAPGINLKPKARKNAMRCSVMNEAWFLVGYTRKENSADQVREDIAKLAKDLEAAKSEREVVEIEGKLMALEESCDLLDPEGPFVRSIRGDQVIVDDASVEDDHSDANWMMCSVWFPTTYLNARYRQENKDGQMVSAYQPTHVVDARQNANEEDVTDVQRQIDTFHIFQQGQDQPSDYGYSNRNAYERAKMTQCWYAFDKVKRRFYLYADKDFTWPIWVFDDPYHLPTFFPLFKLQYHTDPKLTRTKGEVSHYLDQQDAINTIDDEMNRARTTLQDRVWADSELDQKRIEELMLSTERKVVSLKVPDGKKLTEMIMAPPIPSMQYQHLWDKAPIVQSVNQISGMLDAMRGEQLKTNTTNKAIEFYSSTSNVRLDEKRDAIEDVVGEVVWAVVFMCLQFMPMERILQIAGVPDAANNPLARYTNLPPQQIREEFACQCVGGSTQKPTSGAKKAEALQVGQILGQFAGLPYAGLLAVKGLSRAFDGFVITRQDWEMLLQTMMMQLQPQQATPNEDPNAEAEDGEEAAQQQEGEMVKEIQARAKQRGGSVTPGQARNALHRRANGAQAPQ